MGTFIKFSMCQRANRKDIFKKPYCLGSEIRDFFSSGGIYFFAHVQWGVFRVQFIIEFLEIVIMHRYYKQVAIHLETQVQLTLAKDFHMPVAASGRSEYDTNWSVIHTFHVRNT